MTFSHSNGYFLIPCSNVTQLCCIPHPPFSGGYHSFLWMFLSTFLSDHILLDHFLERSTPTDMSLVLCYNVRAFMFHLVGLYTHLFTQVILIDNIFCVIYIWNIPFLLFINDHWFSSLTIRSCYFPFQYFCYLCLFCYLFLPCYLWPPICLKIPISLLNLRLLLDFP